MKPIHFRLALQLAYKSKHKHRLGAVLIKNRKVVSIGFNKIKTHPRSTHPYKTIHAEMDAIFSCDPKDLAGSELYIYRITKRGAAAIAKPCSFCVSLIKKSGIKLVHYSLTEGSYGTTII